MMSAWPSWFVSRSAATEALLSGLATPEIFFSGDCAVPSSVMYTSPFEATATWRPCATLSANTVAQQPWGSTVSSAFLPGQEDAAAVAAPVESGLPDAGAFSPLLHAPATSASREALTM